MGSAKQLTEVHEEPSIRKMHMSKRGNKDAEVPSKMSDASSETEHNNQATPEDRKQSEAILKLSTDNLKEDPKL